MVAAGLRGFSNQKVFITGHTGFKGSWLSSWLLQLGAELKGYSLAPDTNPSLYSLLRLEENMESVFADIRDDGSLVRGVVSFQPDYIFHLAAQPLVRKSYQYPLETFTTNAIGTANVLEAARNLQKPCAILCITTDKVYENKEWYYPYRESDRLGGWDPYSASKACAELIASSFRQSFFHPDSYAQHRKAIATVRAGNVIGGGDWSEDRLLPDIVRSLAGGKEVQIRNPGSVRPWQHVLDPLGGYLKLALRLVDDPAPFSGAWNFGPAPEDAHTVLEVANRAVDCWGKGDLRVNAQHTGPHEANLLKLDISKARTELDWQPRMDFASSVERAISWYRRYYNGENARALVEEDLAHFQSLMNY